MINFIREIVMMGRTPHLHMLQSESAKDYEIVESALEKVGMEQYGNRRYASFTEAPSKVITNNPSSTDLLLELGLGDKIIGIMKPDNAPDEKWAAAYENLTVLGDKMTMSKEVIIGSEPDFIFGRTMPCY